jgi:hypothetical protein
MFHIYNILCVFSRWEGRKLKQNLEGGARCKSLGTSGIVKSRTFRWDAM